MTTPPCCREKVMVYYYYLLTTLHIHLWLENSRTILFLLPHTYLSPVFLFFYLSVLLSFCSSLFIFVTIKSLFSTRYVRPSLENSRTLSNSRHPIPISALISLFSYPSAQSTQLLSPELIVPVTLRDYSMRSATSK